MANQEHLEILKQGVEVWNQWRETHQDVRPDFTKADFSETVLSRVVLFGANFSGTELSEAYFFGANLSGVDFSAADLYGVTLRAVDLNYTDFRGAGIGFTIFADVDLSSAIGLDSIYHESPSTVGLDTIYKSKGNIPEIFLRGCGLPDEFISYIPSLTGKGIEYYSCFISHRDKDFAKRMHNDLQAKGVRCWFAAHDMKIGDKIRPTIDDSIRLHDKLLLILSEHSVQSDWVEHEVEHTLDLERERKKTSLFPVRIDEAIMESSTGWAGNVKHQRHIGDFTQWKQHDAYQAAFARLLRDLKAG